MRFQALYEGRWIFLLLLLLTGASILLAGWLAVVFALLTVYALFFFRDPSRPDPGEENAIVAAADGVVADVVETEEPLLLKARSKRVGIFLSIFDVHTNRAPIAGRIILRQHRAGLCLDARDDECSLKNESMAWGFQNSQVTIVVRQLTGAIARRIVAWSHLGDELKRGDRFGMIRFGSRTEMYLPLGAEIAVKVGDRVKGGSSVIARLPQ